MIHTFAGDPILDTDLIRLMMTASIPMFSVAFLISKSNVFNDASYKIIVVSTNAFFFFKLYSLNCITYLLRIFHLYYFHLSATRFYMEASMQWSYLDLRGNEYDLSIS